MKGWPNGSTGRCSGRFFARAFATLLFVQGMASLAQAAESGLHVEPRFGWSAGDHHVDLATEFRYRYENWHAYPSGGGHFNALRTRLGLDYRYRDW